MLYNKMPLSEISGRPRIVCLCGSTRFGPDFDRAHLEETLAGNIVLSIGTTKESDESLFCRLEKDEYNAVKARLDVLHFQKIELADEILVVNKGGYIGDSTRKEIEYAKSLNKPIRYLYEVS